MKIALIYCPFEQGKRKSIPYGLIVLSTFLKKKYDVRCFDFNIQLFSNKTRYYFNHLLRFKYLPFKLRCSFAARCSPFGRIYKQWLERIISESPDIIGFSVHEENLLMSIRLAVYIKKKHPEKIIVFGGWVTIKPSVRDFLLKHKIVDYILVGEGEGTFLHLLRCLEKRKDVEKTIFSNNHLTIKDLDTLPVPDYSDFCFKDYPKTPLFYDISRGCTNNCDFCIGNRFLGPYRHKSVRKVCNDIRFLISKYPNSKFSFVDSLINSNPKNLKELCNRILKNNLKFNWVSNATCNNLSLSLVKKMYASGCSKLALGFESGSGHVLQAMNKKTDIINTKRIMNNTKKIGIKIYGLFIVGHPAEKWDDFFETFRFIWDNRMNMDSIDIQTLKICEGSNLYNSFNKNRSHPQSVLFWYIKGNNYIIRLLRYITLISEWKLLKIFDKLTQ